MARSDSTSSCMNAGHPKGISQEFIEPEFPDEVTTPGYLVVTESSPKLTALVDCAGIPVMLMPWARSDGRAPSEVTGHGGHAWESARKLGDQMICPGQSVKE